MTNNKIKTHFMFMGTFILLVFGYVSIINIFPNVASDSYLSTENSFINASVKSTYYTNGKLVVTVNGEATKGCIKSTKTIPDKSSACWVSVDNYRFSSSVLKNKVYYVWLMNENGQIGSKYSCRSK